MDRYTKELLEGLDLRVITVTHSLPGGGYAFSTIVGPSKRIYAQFAQILMPSTGNKLAAKGHAASPDGHTHWILRGTNLDEPISQTHATAIKLYTLTEEAYYGAVLELAVPYRTL